MNKVLIAEDNIIKQEYIKKLLNEHSIKFKLVDTYSECWKVLFYDHDDYEKLILDMSMPRFKDDNKIYKFAGLDILKRLHYSNINIPTVILTGHIQFTVDTIIRNLDSVIKEIKDDEKIKDVKVIRYDNKSASWENEILNFIKKDT